MRLRIVDAFTHQPFRGNPAAVVILDPADPQAAASAADEGWMQAVAAEMNLSETAFAFDRGPQRGAGHYDLRWFTPVVEVDLCGHATLATAHVLAADARPGPFRFATRSGELRADVDSAGAVHLDFPAQTVTPVEDPGLLAALEAALHVTPLACARTSGGDVLVEVDSPASVRALTVDLVLLADIAARGVVVTSRGDHDRAHSAFADVPDEAPADAPDVVSRFFGPRVGVAEDPVTGSAHCALAPYWVPRLGRARFLAHQLSSRGGVLDVELRGDRVLLTGRAVTVLDGNLLTPGDTAAPPYTSSS
ncbi:MAG: PhzF family phenazine biosynthesis protein [Janthinobacterium lividum]